MCEGGNGFWVLRETEREIRVVVKGEKKNSEIEKSFFFLKKKKNKKG
jgi:hypothetical protein